LHRIVNTHIVNEVTQRYSNFFIPHLLCVFAIFLRLPNYYAKIETTRIQVIYTSYMYDNNSEFSTRYNKTSNSHVMRLISIIVVMIINNIYINYTWPRYINFGFRCFDAARFANSQTPAGDATHSLNTSGNTMMTLNIFIIWSIFNFIFCNAALCRVRFREIWQSERVYY